VHKNKKPFTNVRGFFFAQSKNFAIVSSMALPREFRRLRILLVGFGDVAKRLADQRLGLQTRRHGPRVIAVSRSRPTPENHTLLERMRESRSQWLCWDIDQTNRAVALARIGQAAILFAPPAESHNSSHDARSRTLANAIRRAQKRTPLVYLSTTGVYGDQRGGSVRETSTCRPRQPRSQRRLDAENVLRPLGAHVLRVPGIYAHNRLPIARLKAQTPALRKEDDVRTNHIHADDLAKIAWLALFRGKPARVTNTVDQTQMTMGEYFDAVALTLGLPKPPRVSLQEMKRLAQEGAISPMALSFFLESRQVQATRLENELRLALAYPTVADCLKTLKK
jgi:nucleoside-diphosphate-sugar epimerase